VHDAPLVERVASALMKTQQFEKAGEFFESLDRLQSALDAYSKAHSYRRAVELSRKAFPAQVFSFTFFFFFFFFLKISFIYVFIYLFFLFFFYIL
jgi:hypothetical protein